MSTAIKNPRKKFNFGIAFPLDYSIPDFGCQKVTLPEVEIEQTEHGVGNTVQNTPGMVKTGKLTVSMIEPNKLLPVSDAIYALFKAIQDPTTGFGMVDGYEITITVTEYSPTMTPLNTWVCNGCWPSKVNGKEYDRVSSDNLVNEIEFVVFSCVKY